MAKIKLTFAQDFCKGCLLCVDTCPKKILRLNLENVNQKGYNPVECVDMGVCTGCAMCAFICPDSVIGMEREDS
ncbi:MAG: 4Fe-4S dicluster domain-containing protein [Defluviitaleaceae bacterium]|nr:4Fe-4S dicluster domain-containing protein [Defluviitaleaceae bacterium]MCL2835151.1 4Fe-4S dicluster domain-containing protein [Defluviitaleaceae bacterium]